MFDSMPDPSKNPQENARAPASRAYGAVVLLTVIGAATITLTYTMLPLPGQRELGPLNYVAATLCLLLLPISLKRYRPARTPKEDPAARPRIRSRARR